MDERIVEGLVDLGLSRYEARAYVSLFQQEPETAEGVATAAEVPKGRIYDVLNALTERSLVRSDDERPKTYTVVGAARAVDRLLETRLDELDEQRVDYERTAERLRRSLSSLETDESDAGFSTSAFHHDEARELLLDRFEAAEESIRIVVDEATARTEGDEELDELLRRRVDEGIEIRLLLVDAAERGSELNGEGFDVRVVDPDRQPEHRFAVIDGAEACIEVVRPVSPDRLLAVVDFRNNQPARELAETFEALWDAATPAEQGA
ncbi:TrmB family transcriptional regulator [Halalkalicoccus tibetensis]|uniref:TrmB family transcriptional regulator n=1 Tax=Halalkalicoccus tibetensis TaxID=175632 RepID=A0ABD5V5T0_9EURY